MLAIIENGWDYKHSFICEFFIDKTTTSNYVGNNFKDHGLDRRARNNWRVISPKLKKNLTRPGHF